MEKIQISDVNIPNLIFETFVSVFWVKLLKCFDADPVPGSGVLSTLDPRWKKVPWIREKTSRIRNTIVTYRNTTAGGLWRTQMKHIRKKYV
jgi:hypothetical protein